MFSSSVMVEVPDDDYWRRQIKCQYACPVNTDARGYVRAIARGDFEAAYLIARGPNPLASICGRVCGAPCEAACRRGTLDQPVAIRALKRFVTSKFGPESFTHQTLKPIQLLQRVLERRAKRDCSAGDELAALQECIKGSELRNGSGKKVAIIGSGPAGLAVAHDLALLGHRPTVFEMEPIPAGMLAVGIPDYRLPRDLIRAEVEVIRALGVEFRCNTQVVADADRQDAGGREDNGDRNLITLKEIRRDFAATVIAVGAKRSRVIPIPGGDGPGVLGGVELLRDVALWHHAEDGGVAAPRGARLAALGKKIVVIGGGNVAYDVSRTVVRQVEYDVSRSALREAHVGEVQLCCLESIDEMPADDVEILEGHEEGVRLRPSLGPVEIHRRPDKTIQGITFKRCLRVFDEQGRFAPQFDESDTTTIEADTVIWSIGQQADLSFVDPGGDVSLDDRGLIECDQGTLRTSAKDVFLAGDIAYGPRLLIDAVASGKRCARSVHSLLTGETLKADHTFVHLNLPDYRREHDYEKVPRSVIRTRSPEERKTSQTMIVEQDIEASVALQEASRCFDCGVNTIFDSEKCILCGGCADVCPELCLKLVSCDRLVGDPQLQTLLKERYGEADLSEHSAIVKDEDKCIRCALCAERCPTSAITMERFGFTATWAGAGA